MRWTVVRGTGRTVTLRSHLGAIREFDLLDVIGDPSYSPHLRPDEYTPADRLFLTGLTPQDRAAILEKEAVVLEVLTGYRSGRSDTPAQNEPRPAYDPIDTRLTDRYAAAARELDCGQSTVRRLCQRYRQHGLAGLHDRRAEGNRKSPWKAHPLQDVIATVSQKAQDGSTVTRKVHIQRIVRSYKDQHPGAALPSERTLYRLMDGPARKHGLAHEAKTRQSKANSPKEMHFQIVASRLGEYVLIDASPWDILLRGIHHPDEARRYRMLVAFDLYHRGVVGFSLHAGEPQAVDAVYLLHDILNPKHLMPGWPQDMRYPYTGVPEHVVLEQYLLAPDVQLTAQGFVAPSSVTIDNGAIFTSRLFQDACRRLGITVILSRPYTPTDKGAVERFFGTVEREFAAQFPGYVGHSAAHRGKEPQVEQLMWVDEFRDAFLRYYCTAYMRRPHKELFHPDHPRRKFSPAEMFDLGLRTGGLIRVPLDADIYYQLLPSAPRKIRPDGVEMNGLMYDHPGLDPFRGDSQRHSFSYDPRDLRYLFHRTEEGQWLRLHRKPARFPHLPFTEGMLRAARAEPGAGLRISPTEANERLDAIIRDFEDVTRQRKRSRPEVTAAARLDRAQEDRERTRAPLPVDPPAPPPPEPQAPPVPASFSRVDFTQAADDMDLSELFDD
nr:helix-turn-helix domain-containing protein [Deinococcus sp. HSC-46F16]